MDAIFATPVASATGLAAAACLVACPLLRGRGPMLLAQLGVGALFAVHYGVMGVAAAAAMQVLGSLQTVAAIAAPRAPVLARAGYALIPVMVIAGLWFGTGPTASLAVAAMATIAVARMQTDETDLRLMLLGGTLLWAAHDALVAAWIALGADLLAGGLGIGMLIALNRGSRLGGEPRIAAA